MRSGACSTRSNIRLESRFFKSGRCQQELSELAENLDISIGELISQFFEQGVALTWDAFEHEAKQKREERSP